MKINIKKLAGIIAASLLMAGCIPHVTDKSNQDKESTLQDSSQGKFINLFNSPSSTANPISINLTANFPEIFQTKETILSSRSGDLDDYPFNVKINDQENAQIFLNGRSSLRVCPFPNLKLKTQDNLSWYITTHCGIPKKTSSLNGLLRGSKLGTEEGTKRNSVAMKLLYTLGVPALRTKNFQINYKTIDGTNIANKFAFISEDLSLLADRIQGAPDFTVQPQSIKNLPINSKRIDMFQVMVLHMFQIMIQNDDWDLHDINIINPKRKANLHNVLIIKKGATQIPVAIDFDLATFVNPNRPLIVSKRLSPEIQGKNISLIEKNSFQYIKEYKEIHQARSGSFSKVQQLFFNKKASLYQEVDQGSLTPQSKQNARLHLDAFFYFFKNIIK